MPVYQHGAGIGDLKGNVGGIYFDGADDYGIVNDSASFDLTGDFTLELDLIVAERVGTQDQHFILTKYNTSGSNRKFAINWTNGSQTLSANFGNTSGGFDGSVSVVMPSTYAPFGQWIHVAVVYKASGKQYMYIDGELKGYSTDSGGGTKVTSENIFLGVYSLLNTTWLKGNVGNIRIWDVAKEQKDIQRFMKRAVTFRHPNLKMNLRFNEATGTVNDDSGNGNSMRRIVGTTSTRGALGVPHTLGN